FKKRVKSGMFNIFLKFKPSSKRAESVAGFTLIELLIVLAIIGLLAGVVLLALNNARVRGRDAKRVGDMRQSLTSLEQYFIQHGTYPMGTASTGANGALFSDPAAMDSDSEAFVPA